MKFWALAFPSQPQELYAFGTLHGQTKKKIVVKSNQLLGKVSGDLL